MTKSAMITIAGRPNVGKSTLTNAIVGEKVAIVSNKPQTTRNRICGVLTRGETQLVFMDTPGFHKARTRLGDYMVNVVQESVADVDAVFLLVEPIANIGPQEERLIEQITKLTNEQTKELLFKELDEMYKNSEIISRSFEIKDNKMTVTFECIEEIGREEEMNDYGKTSGS